MQDADFVKERLDVLLEMKRLFDSWDGTATAGIKVIEKNNEHIASLQNFDGVEGMVPLSQSENELLIQIVQKNKLVLYTLRSSRDELLQQAKQVNQKSRIIESYLHLKKKPTFIDIGI